MEATDESHTAGIHAGKRKRIRSTRPLTALYESSADARHFRMSSARIRRRFGVSRLGVVAALRRGWPSESLAIPRIALSPQTTILQSQYPQGGTFGSDCLPPHTYSVQPTDQQNGWRQLFTRALQRNYMAVALRPVPYERSSMRPRIGRDSYRPWPADRAHRSPGPLMLSRGSQFAVTSAMLRVALPEPISGTAGAFVPTRRPTSA